MDDLENVKEASNAGRLPVERALIKGLPIAWVSFWIILLKSSLVSAG